MGEAASARTNAPVPLHSVDHLSSAASTVGSVPESTSPPPDWESHGIENSRLEWARHNEAFADSKSVHRK